MHGSPVACGVNRLTILQALGSSSGGCHTHIEDRTCWMERLSDVKLLGIALLVLSQLTEPSFGLISHIDVELLLPSLRRGASLHK
jgi:hypothetical protein